MGSGNNQDNLTAAYIDHTVVIRVEGRGSFKISPPMKQFIQKVMETKSAYRILIDMSGCSSMDSTFMGVLAGLSYHMKEKAGFTLKLINLSEKNQKLLITLGVDRVVSHSLSTTDEEKALMAHIDNESLTLGTDHSDALGTAKTTLEAHETLVEINPDNLVKFKSVLELLQKDVRSLGRQ